MIGPDLEQFAEELSAYLDGELSPEKRQIVEAKLSASAQARQLLDDLRTTSRILDSLPRHAAPPAIVADLNTQLERSELLAGFDEAETAVVTSRPGWFPRLSMAAMIAVVAIGGWWMMTGPALSPNQDQFALAEKSTPGESPEGFDRSVSKARTRSAKADGKGAKTRSLDTADVETKLAAGIAPQALRAHAFANEPIRLVIPVRYQSEQAALLSRLARKLASTNAIDLASADSSGAAPVGAFYYRGRSGVNYKKGAPRQILIRATRAQIDQVLQEIQSSRNGSNVRLKAGALTLRGSRKAREALTLLVSPDGDSRVARSNRTETQEELLDNILESLGVDPKTFLQRADHRGSADQPDPDRDPDRDTLLAMANESKRESPEDSAARSDKFASAKRSRPSPSAPTNATRPREVAVANTELSVTTSATSKKRLQPTATYVTFVIELPLTEPASNKSGTPKMK